MLEKYILKGTVAVRCDDLLEWAKWCETADRVVWQTKVAADCQVSTIFLGINHNWGEGPPLLFETMVFGGPHDLDQVRWSTWVEAEQGHQEVVEALQQQLAYKHN